MISINESNLLDSYMFDKIQLTNMYLHDTACKSFLNYDYF